MSNYEDTYYLPWKVRLITEYVFKSIFHWSIYFNPSYFIAFACVSANQPMSTNSITHCIHPSCNLASIFTIFRHSLLQLLYLFPSSSRYVATVLSYLFCTIHKLRTIRLPYLITCSLHISGVIWHLIVHLSCTTRQQHYHLIL